MKRWIMVMTLLLALIVVGCGDAGEEAEPEAPATPALEPTPTTAPLPTESPTATAIPTATAVEDGSSAPAALPALGELQEGWNELKPAGSTTCAQNTEYAFFVRPGDPEKVMLHLQGGGACWNGDICRIGASQTYDASVSIDDNPERTPFGLFDLDNPENPVAEYTMLYVPYCTADVHLGDREATYEDSRGDEVTVEHNGYENVAAVLDWLTDNIDAPETVFVNGSSAGAIASPVYAAALADAYPAARVVQLGDGGGGFRVPEAAPQIVANWGTTALLEEEIGFPPVEESSFTFKELYVLAAERHPEIRFAQYNTIEDEVQRFFLSLVEPNEAVEEISLAPLLRANLTDVDAVVENFTAFTAGGELHTILQRPEFYTYAADGVRVVDWVTELVNGDTPPTVSCETCDAPEIITAEEAAGVPALSDLPAEWSELKPFGDTMCADGSDFSFFVHPGDPERLMIFFQGGGACWDQPTCSPVGMGTYDRNVSSRDNPTVTPLGIFARNNPENPVTDYTTIFVPYCTGDVHLGNNRATYGTGAGEFTVEHRGFVNASAVLAWTFENVTAPEQVFVTGSSAGAIPSPFYARFVAEQYPDARIVQLGDGAGGYRIDSGAELLAQWGTIDVVAAYPEYADVSPEDLTFETLYTATGARFPEVVLSQYNTAADQTQRLFLALLGVTDTPLLDLLLANYADIEAQVPDFVTFTAGGNLHTILQRPQFYSYAVEGVRVRDWLAALLDGEPVETVLCTDCAQAQEVDP